MDLSTIKPEGSEEWRRRRPPTHHARCRPVRRGYPVLASRSRQSPPPTGGLFHPPATAQGERSVAASPWTPTGPLASLALHPLPAAWGYTRSPYGRRKRAQRSLVRRGTDAARPPATPSAAGCAGAATAVAAASTADGPRGARPRARASTRSRTLRRHGGRPPSRARTEPRTSPRAGRGGWWRLPCRPLTGSALPRRISQELKRRAAGS